MADIKDKERALIEFTCIPEIDLEKAEKLYDIGFKQLWELLSFSLDDEAKVRGLVEVLNFRILQQFLTLDAEDIPAHKYKCPFCMGTVYGDEEACSDCGALLLEEILEVEMEDVYKGLREMIDTVLENPEPAEKFLTGMREDDLEITQESIEIITKEIGDQATMVGGFSAALMAPDEDKKNFLILISPLGEREKEKEKAFDDFKNIGANEAHDFKIEGGNIANKQEEAVREAVSNLIEESDFSEKGSGRLFILNLKIAKFMEDKATIIIEDNRHFLSSMDGVTSDDPKITEITNMLYDVKLIKEMRKIGENFILDSLSFNNDPISFLLARECIPILKRNSGSKIHIVDAVVNTNYISKKNHSDLVHLLLDWNK